jgi:hypothetical protein
VDSDRDRIDPENPRDLRGAPLTLSGTVAVVDDRVYLETETGRWRLAGRLIAGFLAGTAVAVTGRPDTGAAEPTLIVHRIR